MSLLAPIHDYVDSLVHASARQDALTAARHRAFIAPRLLGGLLVLAVFPLALALRGLPTATEAIFFSWFILPILIAWYLSRTGRFARASMLSSVAVAGLVGAMASQSGGIASFAAVWLVLVPFEAALSASRPVVVVAGAAALATTGVLLLLGAAGVLPEPSPEPAVVLLSAMGIGSAALYGTGLALAVESLARTGHRLRSVGEARYWLLARNMTDIIARHGRNGSVLFISPAAERLIGVAEAELIGHGLFDRVHLADRPAYLTALADAAREAGGRSVEFRLRRGPLEPRGPQGAAFIWIEMRCRPLDGQPDGNREVVSVMRDVTERKVQQQALESAHAEAERASAAKGRFLATMSHELRTPLNAIIGFSDMLVNGDALNIGPVRRREYAQLINDSGQHLLAVVNGILDMSRIEMGRFEITAEPFLLAAVVRNCCDLLALRAREAGIDLVVCNGDGIGEIIADKRAVKQILINLLVNAIKFTESGGRVTVATEAERGFVSLSVTDTGVGIDEADIPRLGDPFFQVRGSYDRPHDGTGLGLSIVKGLLELHGGTMEIVSRRHEGTRITVRLPMDCQNVGRRDDAKVAPIAPAAIAGDVRMKKRA
ncbi:MAG TPA: PAS domain-containing sensor histidine kinase [Xanthobacteraceae bacterium]|nr:PAS domain-containing sensor histidine kinase [Xanthobacteraceae bacterium]